MNFYNEICKLKQVLRRGWIIKNVPGRIESDAEHCFSMQMLALEIMAKNKLKLDELKVLKMIAYHELGEIEIGDITIHDNITIEEKYKMELAAIEKFSKQAKMPEILELWLEFEENKTPEAQFVKLIDRYDAVLYSKLYNDDYNFPAAFDEFKLNYKEQYSKGEKFKRSKK